MTLYGVFPIILFGLAGLYLLQTASPLRLDSDAVDYLSTGAAIADGRPLPKVAFPPGYPLVIALLDRAGMGSSFFFVLANCLFLGLGVWAAWRLFGDYSSRVRMWIVVATLLVISVVKSVAAPLPEAAFFGTSLVSLAAASAALSAAGAKRPMLLAVSFAVAALAVSIRLVGVALIPALAWASLSAIDDVSSAGRPRRWAPAIAFFIVLALATVVIVLSRTPTVTDYLMHPRFWYGHAGELSWPVVRRIYGILGGIGQLVINLPYSRFHSLGPVFAATGLVSVVGMVVARRRPARVNLVDIYLMSYLAVLAFWPYDSPRLWMPIAPLMAAHMVSALDRAQGNRRVRIFIPLYAAWFALTGIAALAYTTRISLSGSEFPRLYGTDGGMATTALHTMGPKEMLRYNAQADTLLHRFGRW